MECLLSIVIRELFNHIWKLLIMLKGYFRDLCSSTIRVNDLLVKEKNIYIILYKLERIFFPGSFDLIEHFPIHMAYKARVYGPIQYRWMYPFEKDITRFKRIVKDKVKLRDQYARHICR